MQQFDKHGGCVDTEGEFVWMVYLALSFMWKEHGRTLVNEQLAAEVGLLLKLFDVETIGATVEMPVDVTGAFARVILTVVGELDREAMEGTAVPAGDETFNHLTSEEVQGLISGYLTLVHFFNVVQGVQGVQGVQDK